MADGVFVLGMHRSGTSAATRLLTFLGLHAPGEADLVGPSQKNPTGYWESLSLVAFSNRVLAAVGSDESCPLALPPGWELDARLDDLRREAPSAVHDTFPDGPWVWKDPRHCLTFPFWTAALAQRPVVVLVHRNPLEIVASALRLRPDEGKIYALALWERYVREALRHVEGLPVLVTRYEGLVAEPLAWCARARAFLAAAGLDVHDASQSEVDAFVDPALRHVARPEHEVHEDPDVSSAQRALVLALVDLVGGHERFEPPALPPETPATEALLAERRRSLQVRDELERLVERERRSRWGVRLRRSRALTPVRALYLRARRRGSAGRPSESPAEGGGAAAS